MKLTGRAAQFGRGIAQDVATKMLGQFAECLEREISGGGAAREAASAASEESGNGAATQEEAAPAAATVGGTAGRVISSEDPSVMAGGTVEGAVLSDGATEAAGTEAPRREPEEQEAFDLGAASQEAILKRVGPVLVGLGLLAFLIWLIRR